MSVNSRTSVLHGHLFRAWVDMAKLPNLAQVKIALVTEACAADDECLTGLNDHEAEPVIDINRENVSAQTNLKLKCPIIQETKSDFRCPLMVIEKSHKFTRLMADLWAINGKEERVPILGQRSTVHN